MASSAHVRPIIDVFPHTSYVVNEKELETTKRKDSSIAAKLTRMKQRFESHGTIHSVDAVMLVSVHSCCHVLLLRNKATNGYRLPGGKCRVGEDPVECITRKLKKKLLGVEGTESGTANQTFRVGELLGEFVRPNFDSLMYPYRPPHISKEKEVRLIYLVHLVEEAVLTVLSTFECLAVPLFELYDNNARYGAITASVPQLVSRFQINMC